jgi:hypothetical protein
VSKCSWLVTDPLHSWVLWAQVDGMRLLFLLRYPAALG